MSKLLRLYGSAPFSLRRDIIEHPLEGLPAALKISFEGGEGTVLPSTRIKDPPQFMLSWQLYPPCSIKNN